MEIGTHGKITTEEARELAKKQLALVAHRVDPATRRQAMKELLKSDMEYEVVLIDATETPIERPKKDKSISTPAKRRGIP